MTHAHAPRRLRTRVPSPLDRLDLIILRIAKLRRSRFTDASSFYDAYFTEADILKYERDVRNVWRFGVLGRVCRELFANRSAVIVDVGCGLAFASRYVPDGCRYVGVDFAPATIDAAHGRNPGVDLRVGAFPRLPLGDDMADLAVCTEVLEHVEDDLQAARELARVVRPGGYLLVSVPGGAYDPAYFDLIGHFRHYTPAGLEGLLEQADFQVIRWLPQFRTFWRVYYYMYLIAAAGEALLRRMLGRELSFYRTRGYARCSAAIIASLEARADAVDARSTFVLARRGGASIPEEFDA